MKCQQAFPSFDDHSTCAHRCISAGLCQLKSSKPCQVCQSWSLKIWRKLKNARAKSASNWTRHWTSAIPSFDMWLEGWSTSSDLISEVSSIRNYGTKIIDNSDNVTVSTARDVEVSVHQEPGPNSTFYGSGATVLTCASLPLEGTSVGALVLVQSIGVLAPMLVQGTVLPPVTTAPIKIQDLTFPPVASVPMLIPGVAGAPVSIQGYTPNGRCDDAQSGHAISCCIHGSSYLAYMPSFLPRTQVAPSTTLSEHELLALELEARELEVERRTQALRETVGSVHLRNRHQLNQSLLVPKLQLKHPSPQKGLPIQDSCHQHCHHQDCEPPGSRPNPPQSHSESTSVDKKTPQVIESPEGGASEQEGPNSGTPELDQLVLMGEEH